MKKYREVSDDELISVLKEEAIEYGRLRKSDSSNASASSLRVVTQEIEDISSEIKRRSLKSMTDMPSATRSIQKFNLFSDASKSHDPSGDSTKIYTFSTSYGDITWSTKIERLDLIRDGLPYDAIEHISSKANLPVRDMLVSLGLAQTTYNKRKREQERLNRRDSELLLVLFETLDFGVEVFNNEVDKFHRWLKKVNISLGGVTPVDLFDSITGIGEVRLALYRLEYGNMV